MELLGISKDVKTFAELCRVCFVPKKYLSFSCEETGIESSSAGVWWWAENLCLMFEEKNALILFYEKKSFEWGIFFFKALFD